MYKDSHSSRTFHPKGTSYMWGSTHYQTYHFTCCLVMRGKTSLILEVFFSKLHKSTVHRSFSHSQSVCWMGGNNIYGFSMTQVEAICTARMPCMHTTKLQCILVWIFVLRRYAYATSQTRPIFLGHWRRGCRAVDHTLHQMPMNTVRVRWFSVMIQVACYVLGWLKTHYSLTG